MTEANQKIMYDNFVRLSKEGTTDIQRKNCKGYAEDILKSFPQFKKSKGVKKVAEEPEKKEEEEKEEETKSDEEE